MMKPSATELTFLLFEDGPLASRRPVINPGPWPPPRRIAVTLPQTGRGDAAPNIQELSEVQGAPAGTVVYCQVARSQMRPGRGTVVNANYRLEL